MDQQIETPFFMFECLRDVNVFMFSIRKWEGVIFSQTSESPLKNEFIHMLIIKMETLFLINKIVDTYNRLLGISVQCAAVRTCFDVINDPPKFQCETKNHHFVRLNSRKTWSSWFDFLPHLYEMLQPTFVPNKATQGQAPFFAGPPPTTRVFATFENPQPSSGVSRRPLMSVLTTVW